MLKSMVAVNTQDDILRLNLAYDNFGMIIKKIDGISPPKVQVNSTDLATFDGSFINSALVSERKIDIKIAFLGTNVEFFRQILYKFFPLRHLITLYFRTDSKLCRIQGVVESNEINLFSESEEADIRIICPNPWFKEVSDPDEGIIKLYSLEPMLEFNDCLSSETNFEISRFNDMITTEFTYLGDVESGYKLKFYISDECGDIKFYDLVEQTSAGIEDKVIEKITGSKLKAGDYIEWSTDNGNKYLILIRDAKSYNILNSLMPNSKWFKTHFGINRYGVEASSETSVPLRVEMESSILYQGV